MKTRFWAAAIVAIGALAVTVPAAVASPMQLSADTEVRDGNNNVIGTLAMGTVVDAEYCANGNCRVRANGLRGFVPQGILVNTPEPQNQTPQPQPPAPNNGGGNGGGGNGGGGNGNGGGNGGGGGGGGGPSFSFDFGIGNQGPPPRRPGHRPPPPRNDDAEVCFFDQSNFRGKSFCVEEGDSDDSLPASWNDRISSIQVDDGLTVEVCRNEDMRGTCAQIDGDISRLPSSLNDRISSYEVY